MCARVCARASPILPLRAACLKIMMMIMILTMIMMLIMIMKMILIMIMINC